MVSVPGVGFVPVSAPGYWENQLAIAAKAAANREAALLRRAIDNQKHWEVAQEAEKSGDLRVAARMYQRLALRRPPSPITQAAQQRLSNIQSAAQTKLQGLESQLAQASASDGTPAALRRAQLDETQVKQAFDELDKLALQYAGVATVDNVIAERRSKLRKIPQYAAILQEPAAAELWKVGQEHETKQQACCALLVYEQAASLTPAPSAQRAKARLAELTADKAVVESAKRCRDLQLCHENFRRAQVVKADFPDQARKYLSQIIELAPADTPVHKAAREQIAMLK